MNKIFIVTFAIFFIFIIQVLPTLAAPTYFNGVEPVQKTQDAPNFVGGLKTTGNEMGYSDPKEGMSYMSFFAKMIGSALTPIFFGVSGMLSFAYAGYKWMMANGNEQDIELAKTIIINTIIAMIVALSAYAIVNFIINVWVNPIINVK